MKWILIGITTDSIVIKVVNGRNGIHELLLSKAWQIDGGGFRDVDAVLTSFATVDSGLLGLRRNLLGLVFC